MAQLITAVQQAVLRVMGDGPSDGLSLTEVERLLPQVKQARSCLYRLYERGWLARERRHDPETPRTNPYATNCWRFFFWRSEQGTEILRRLDAGAGVWLMTPEEEATRAAVHPRAHDDEALLAPTNMSRGAVTFRATMADFGLRTAEEVEAMSLPTWRAFHDRWTEHMKAACAAAGEPIRLDEPPARRGADD